MDFNKLIARVKAILTTPRTEWPIIGAEPATVADLYKNYIIWLAAIPAVFGFIKGSLIGHSLMGITIRTSIGGGITSMIIGYLLTLVLVFVVALIVDALAPTFGALKSQVQAVKVVAYAYTASWVASIALVIPWIGWLIVLAGGIYAIYLLYLGLPHTMRCPPEKAAGYTALTVVIAIILGWILAIVVAGIAGTGAALSGVSSIGKNSSSNVTIDQDSTLGKLATWGKSMEEAGKRMDKAQKSGDQDAQSNAAGDMMGAVLGGGDKVEALAPSVLKPFVPETLNGMPRTSVSAERSGAMGMQISEAKGTFSDGSRTLRLEINDLGSAKGMLALAGLAGVGNEKETDHGYEKTYKKDGRLIKEKWDTQTQYGEFSITLGNRFTVKATGNADSMDQIKAAVASVDLAGLEKLKDAGVKKG